MSRNSADWQDADLAVDAPAEARAVCAVFVEVRDDGAVGAGACWRDVTARSANRFDGLMAAVHVNRWGDAIGNAGARSPFVKDSPSSHNLVVWFE